MRTTLKRRTGWNGGNGAAGAVPPAPPAPPPPWSPVSRYRGPGRGILQVAGRILLWLVVLILVAAGAILGGAWIYINESVSAIRAHSPEARAAQEVLDVPLPGKPTVAMVLGYDKRAGVERALEARSDTVMMIRADPEGKVISMLSFPRDLIVDIPACKGHSAFRSRINEAYTYCGPKGTLQTVKALTGIKINYLITVNFRGFKQIVNKVGGVYLDIDRRYLNDNSQGGAGYATINLKPGYQKLAGGPALDYVRYRHTDSDFFRIKRQQEFVKAFKQRISGLVSITKLPGVVNAITENVEVGVGGGKSLDFDTVVGYAKLAYGLPSGNFHQIQIDPNAISGYAELSTSDEAVGTAVREFMNPDVEAAEKATAAATRQKAPEPEAPPPGETSIEILNGNGVDGAAGEAAYLLGQRGYLTDTGGNADNFNYFRTKVFYDPVYDGAEEAAAAVAQLFGDGEVAEAPPDAGLSTMLRVIVGQTFKNTLGPSVTVEALKYEPPAVVKDSEAVRPLLRKAQRKAGFQLYVPTVREQSSALDSEAPVRVYRLEDHDAVRIVYRTGTLEYWGVQQTNWTDAPVLEGASVQRALKGRTYSLYYNGTKLHGVAFEENGAAYWVVNTLLDKLSNETMLAIAKGLKPLMVDR